MKEFSVDLVIDKTFNVFAETEQEAKELAIQRARMMMDSYNSLEIDDVYETFSGQIDIEDDCEFENEYSVLCFNPDGILINEYLMEADHTLGAATAAEEFFAEDFSDEILATVRVFPVGVDDEAYDEYIFYGDKEEA